MALGKQCRNLSDQENNTLWLQLDYTLLVVNTHGVELIQNVLPEQTVELNSEAPRKLLQVHHRHALRKHEFMRDLQVHSQTQSIADYARSPIHRSGNVHLHSSKCFRIKDRFV